METKSKDKRKVLLVLPLLVLPFLAFTFNVLGGGKGIDAEEQNSQAGLNTELPNASFKEMSPKDKWSYYEQTERDSGSMERNNIASVAEHLGFSGQKDDPKAEQINLKLQELDSEINRPEPKYRTPITKADNQSVSIKSDVDRLETLMKAMQSDKSEDPEMKELSGMLDKIITIQNPGLLQERLKKQTAQSPDSTFKAIPAVIEGNQKVKQGGLVKLRLLDSIRIKDVLIPKNQLLFGLGTITNQRVLLTIKNIRLGTSIIPVDLSVFSLDGLIGLNAPEAELGIAAGDGASDAIQGTQFLSMDQSIGIQAAGAGIDAAKTLLSKKVKRIKVKLDSGRPVLLRNNQANAN